MDSKSESFGVWLLKKRKNAGLSQQRLAEIAEISKQYVSNIERDFPHPVSGALPKPKIEIVDAIAGAIGVPVAEARVKAGYAPEETQADKRQTKLLIYFNELPEDQKDTAVAMVETLWKGARGRKKPEQRPAARRRTA